MSKLTNDARGFFKKLFDGFKSIFKTTKTTKTPDNLTQNSNDAFLRKYIEKRRKSKRSDKKYRSFGKRRSIVKRRYSRK